VSQHPPGEPHFFVKPFALTKTPPGWSCLLEGIDSDGSDAEPDDVWRGVVRTDALRATPAVFHLWRQGVAFVVPEGQPLLHAIPCREPCRRHASPCASSTAPARGATSRERTVSGP